MELILEKSLEHQQNAVDAVADVFAGVRIDPPTQYYANPVLDIKAGTSSFMMDGAARKHFADVCGYDATLDVQVLEAAKAARNARRESFPAAVWEFVKATKEARRRISILVVNMQLLSESAKMLTKEYDSMFENMRRPFDAIRSTRPIVIIDEPHRFERTQSAYGRIETEVCPQCVIRYGATFPEAHRGVRRGQPKPKD